MNRSRTPSTKSVLEARARMLRGLCRSGLGERIEASADLRWAMDRLNAIDSGSDLMVLLCECRRLASSKW